jgi:ABC-2 type transport system permease protein
VGYLGVLCMAGAYGAVALFFSSQTKNQVVAFLSSVVILFLFTVVASDVTASLLPRAVNDFLNVFSPVYHLQNFIKGVIDFRSLFFFVSITLAMLFFTVIDLGKRE